MAVRGLGAEHGVRVRLALQLHRLTSAAICCVGQSTNDAAKPYQKWSFTIDRAPVKVSRLQIRGQRTLSPASRLAGGPQQSFRRDIALQLHRLTSAAICRVGQPTNNAAQPYQKWRFTIDWTPVKVSSGESEISEFCARLEASGRARTEYHAATVGPEALILCDSEAGLASGTPHKHRGAAGDRRTVTILRPWLDAGTTHQCM